MLLPALTGILLGIGLGILVADGRGWPVVAMVPLGLGLAWMVGALVPAEDRRRVGAIVALAFAVHVAVAVLLYTGSLALGQGGFIPGDDGEYANVSEHVALYLQGKTEWPWTPPDWAGEAYILGAWVYLESAIFLLTGPEVLVPILLNGTFALATALLVFDMTRSLFDRRAALLALVLTAFYPSLVLWSSLNLKDAFALAIIALCLWALVRFQRRPRWRPLALAFLVLIPMESTRQYIFVGLALLVPLVVVLTPRLTLLGRLRWGLPSAAVSVLFIYAMQSGVDFGPSLFDVFEGEREAMGVGARTRFVEAPVLVKEGDTFVVAALTEPPTTPVPPPGELTPPPPPNAPSPPPPPPTLSPNVVHVAPNTRIVVVTGAPTVAAASTAPPRPRSSPTPTPASTATATPTPGATATARSTAPPATAPPVVAITTPAPTVQPTSTPRATDVVYVREGDIIVVGRVEITPAPVPLALHFAGSVQLRAQQVQAELALIRTVDHLPRGLAHSLFAPFPWQIERMVDLVTVPEMLAWFVILAASLATVIRRQRDWRLLAATGGMALGVLLLLALVEGNVGTLYRHRAMAQPWIFLLASPTLVDLATRLAASAPRRYPLSVVNASDAG